MNRQELHQLHRELAELETLEKRIGEWRQVLDDPKTRIGFRDERPVTTDSRSVSVVIQAEYPDHGPNRDKPKLVSPFWTEESIRAAVKLFIDGLVSRAEELRSLLRQRGIDPNSPPAGAHFDYEDWMAGRV
jgi:hypothetical protein